MKVTYIETFHILDPLQCLTLRINHQRPASTSRHDDTVLSRESVTWKTLDIPVADPGRIDKELAKVEFGTDWYLELSDLSNPQLVDVVPITGQEWAHIRQEGRRNQNITNQDAKLLFKILQKTETIVYKNGLLLSAALFKLLLFVMR
jgi:hypothetical protein